MAIDRHDEQAQLRSLGAVAVALVAPAVAELRAGYAELVGGLRASAALARVARRGGADAVLASDEPEVATLRKAGRELATDAERRAEATMRRALNAQLPEHALVGEELGASGDDGELLWVLDPVDGTSAMVRCAIAAAFGLPLAQPRPAFGLTIGLLRRERPVVGVVAELVAGADGLALARTWLGVAGEPTTCDGAPVPAATLSPPLEDAVLACTVPEVMFAAGDARERFARLRRATRTLVVDQNCVGYMRLLGGGVDVVLEADLALADAAALVAPLAGAGVAVTDHDGAPLRFDAAAREREYRLLAAAPDLHRRARAVLAAASPTGEDAGEAGAAVHAGYARKFPARAAQAARTARAAARTPRGAHGDAT